MLHCSVEPDRVRCSTPDRPSVAALTVVVANRGPAGVEYPVLRLLVPSDRIDKASTLTTDPSTITVVAGEQTPWAAGADGDGLLFAVPLPPVIGIPAGERIELRLGEIVVGTLPGTAAIVILAPDGTTHYLPVQKDPAPRSDP